MSNYQNYGTQYMQQYTPQYPANNQNYGYDSTQINHSCVSDEYLRQPAVAPTPPYPTAPVTMPEPVQHLPTINPTINHTYSNHHHHTAEQPRIVIVQQSRNEDECCGFLRMTCGCIDWILTRVCYCITFIIILFVIIALIVYFTKFYKKHSH